MREKMTIEAIDAPAPRNSEFQNALIRRWSVRIFVQLLIVHGLGRFQNPKIFMNVPMISSDAGTRVIVSSNAMMPAKIGHRQGPRSCRRAVYLPETVAWLRRLVSHCWATMNGTRIRTMTLARADAGPYWG